MICQSFFSVVRLLAAGLVLLLLGACTAQHTRELSRNALRDLGLGSAVEVSRTGAWTLPQGTAVHFAPTYVIGADHNAYGRLCVQLDRLLETIASEWFQGDGLRADAALLGRRADSGVLIHLSLAGASDKLSSVREVSENSGLTDETAGRDRLHLVMKVYDARTGHLLDTLSGAATGGWRWREHNVVDLAEPTLRVMLARLRGTANFIE